MLVIFIFALIAFAGIIITIVGEFLDDYELSDKIGISVMLLGFLLMMFSILVYTMLL